MYNLNIMHYIGIAFTLFIIISVGIYSGKEVKSNTDFSLGGRKAGSSIIAGTIMGTLVGGASTIGTSELAFLYGFSAWWFTLGAGIGCLILGLVFVRPIYSSKKATVPQILAEEYGGNIAFISSVLLSVGMFINIVAQILSSIALITSIIDISTFLASIIAVFMMIMYVIFGGVWGTGFVGIAKLILLYISVIMCGILAINIGGGISSFILFFPKEQYFSLFSRGVGVDLGAGFSLVMGVLSTQTYIQAILSGRNEKISRKGALISALLIPIIGVAGIFVGLYMRMEFPDIVPSSAFPMFVLNFLHPFPAGIVIATLIIAVVGTGAGLSLGISTVVAQDIYNGYINKNPNDQAILKMTRILIIIVLFVAMMLTVGNMKSLILKWSFMSMGLRGATVFLPLCGAFFMKGRIKSKYAVSAVIIGPLCVFLSKILLPITIDPLFLGIVASLLIMIIGLLKNKSNITKENYKI